VGLFDLFKRKAKSGHPAADTTDALSPPELAELTTGPDAADAQPLKQRSRWEKAMGRTRALLTAAFASDPDQLVDEDYFAELMDSLVMADVGVELAQGLVAQIEREMHDRGLVKRRDTAKVAREVLLARLTRVKAPAPLEPGRLNVIMLVGVNGNGKTTLAAKLAHRLKGEGRKVLLCAADTFRAAAVDQLRVWAERVGVDIVLGQTGADPASVIYDATSAARSRGTEVLIVDTAGRLQTKHNLMAELQKIAKTVEKAFQSEGSTAATGSGAKDSGVGTGATGAAATVGSATGQQALITNLLVLDATVGQNSLSQAQLFNEACELSGVALTKLDGTARGGGALAIVDLLKVPVLFVGVGEGLDNARIPAQGRTVKVWVIGSMGP
jgi:fused signal recognition particle receptor